MALAAEIASRVGKFHRKLSEARAAPPAAESGDGSNRGPKPRSKPGDEELTGKYQREGIQAKGANAHGGPLQGKPLPPKPDLKRKEVSSAPKGAASHAQHAHDQKKKNAAVLRSSETATQPRPKPILAKKPAAAGPSAPSKLHAKPAAPTGNAGAKKLITSKSAAHKAKPSTANTAATGDATKPRYEMPLKLKHFMPKASSDDTEEASGWWDEVPALLETPAVTTPEVASAQLARAERAYNAAVAKHEAQADRAPNAQWLRTALRSGTTGDRLAAMTLLVQEKPILRLRTLDALLTMAGKSGRRETQQAIDTLTDLFANTLLPKRPLRRFAQQAGAFESNTSDKLLALFYFEEQLRRRYIEFIRVLEAGLRDPIEHFRLRLLRTLIDLLEARPLHEQSMLLSVLANKLGDPDKKVGAQASYLSVQLLQKNRALRRPLVREIENLLMHPTSPPRASLYGVCALNQLALSRSETDLAAHLVRFYFTMFDLHLKRAKEAPPEEAKKTTEDGKRKKQKKKKREKRAEEELERQREEAWMDSKLLSALLTGINRAFPYVGRALDDSLEQYVDQLFRIVHITSFNKSVQALLLIYQLSSHRTQIADRFYRALYAKLLSILDIHGSSKQALFLNILYKALRHDTSLPRAKAILKRLLQVSMHMPPNFIIGALILIAEVLKTKPSILALLQQPEDDDEGERYSDADVKMAEKKNGKLYEEDEEDASESDKTKLLKEEHEWWRGYDPTKREPLYAGAERVGLWELRQLASHCHPTVAKFAREILAGNEIKYESDPLLDFAFSAFLDRFVNKRPKEADKLKAISAMAPAHPQRATRAVAVDSERFAAQAEANVAPDEVFFYRYFKEKAKEKPTKKKKVSAEEGETDDNLADVIGEAVGEGGDEGGNAGEEEEGEGRDLSDDELDPFDDDSEAEAEPGSENFDPRMFDNDSDIASLDSDGEGPASAAPAGSSFAAAEDYADRLDKGQQPDDGDERKHQKGKFRGMGSRGESSSDASADRGSWKRRGSGGGSRGRGGGVKRGRSK